MKSIQIFISILLLAYASTTLKAQSPADSVRITYKGKGITVKSQGDESSTTIKFKDTITKKNITVKVSVKDMNMTDMDSEFDSTFKKTIKIITDRKKERKFIETKLLPNFDIGFVSTDNEIENEFALNPDFTNSANINLGIIKQEMNLYKGKFLFSYGFSINNYYLKYNNRQNMAYLNKQGHLSLYEDTVNYIRKNRMDIFYLTLPFLLEYHSKSNDFNISAGVEYSFGGNTVAVTKGTHESNDYKHKDDTDIKINNTQVNAVLKIGIDHIALYGRYGITDMFQSSAYAANTNPHQHLFSVGLCIFGI